MNILITHLTRMNYPRICIAGLNLQSNSFIRPVVGKGDVLDISQMKLFGLGNIVELGWNQMLGNPPEVEDCYFKLRNAKLQQELNPREFWNVLEKSVATSLTDIFGEELQQEKSTLIVEEQKGRASLGHISVSALELRVNVKNDLQKLRAVFSHSKLKLSVPVTDLRFYQEIDGQWLLNRETVDRVNDLMSEKPAIVLSVGLSRAKSFSDDENAKHWFQVNGIHLESDPLWK
ncbi:MAG: dual OB domain-containing protein [Trueperaceae bacterium]